MQVLDGLQGVTCMMDDILILAATKPQHDSRLMAICDHLQQAGITLNETKCQNCNTSILLCGYIIDSEGIHPDPAKTEALARMPPCQNVADVH